MIIDTTFLLPLARIGVKHNLLRDILNGRLKIRLEDIAVSSISLFEIQAKAYKLGIEPHDVVKAIEAIRHNFLIIPFSESEVIYVSYDLMEFLNDYIDAIIVGTAVATDDLLVTEDKEILASRNEIRNRYGIEIYSYNDLISKYK